MASFFNGLLANSIGNIPRGLREIYVFLMMINSLAENYVPGRNVKESQNVPFPC